MSGCISILWSLLKFKMAIGNYIIQVEINCTELHLSTSNFC